jgi:molybdenum cofactor cytidylyltransferase
MKALPRIAGLLLAAGSSSRMGQAKQLLDWQGSPLVRHVAKEALASNLSSLVVVVGAESAQVQEALAGLKLSIVVNERFAEGQATSLLAGLASLKRPEAVMVLLCDQPFINTKLINRMRTYWLKHRADENKPLALIPRYEGQRGNPVIFDYALFDELRALEGDQGARSVLQRYPERILWYDSDDPAVISDLDTFEAYQQALARSEAAEE